MHTPTNLTATRHALRRRCLDAVATDLRTQAVTVADAEAKIARLSGGRASFDGVAATLRTMGHSAADADRIARSIAAT